MDNENKSVKCSKCLYLIDKKYTDFSVFKFNSSIINLQEEYCRTYSIDGIEKLFLDIFELQYISKYNYINWIEYLICYINVRLNDNPDKEDYVVYNSYKKFINKYKSYEGFKNIVIIKGLMT